MSNILAEHEMATLQGMTVYWQEVFDRDNQTERQCIMAAELNKLISLIGCAKILQIVTEYVKDQSW